MTFKFAGERADEARDACVDMMVEMIDHTNDLIRLLEREMDKGGDHILCFTRIMDTYQQNVGDWADLLLVKLRLLDPDIIDQMYNFQAVARREELNQMDPIEAIKMIAELAKSLRENPPTDPPTMPGYL